MDCNIQQTREVQEEQSFFKVAGEKKTRRKFLIRDGQDGRLIVHQLTRRFVRSTSFFLERSGCWTHSLQKCFSDNLQ